MKKKTICRAAVIILALAAVSVFGLSAAGNGTQAADAASSKVTAEAREEEREAPIGETETAEISMVEQKQAAASGSSQQAEPEAKKQDNKAAESQSAASGKSGKEESTSQGGGGASKPEAEETKPAHTHTWKEFYETATKEIYGDRCKGCPFGTSEADAMYEHIDADPFDSCGSYATGVVIRTYQVKEFAGHKCSCGATK